MSPKKVEADYMMQNYNNDSFVPNTKHECCSPASTKSESCDDSKPFVPHARLKAGHETSQSPLASNRRGRDGQGIIALSRRDKQLMRQMSGLDYDDLDETEEGIEEGGVCVAGIGGVIAPSRRQRQLMRQVSDIGFFDPVFGMNLDLDDSMNKNHACFIFDDMDINDIPEDMREMISLASDRTDVVETDDGQSFDSKSFASVPPLGLEPGASEASLPSTRVKKLRKGKKPRRKSKNLSISHSVTSEPLYVPPAAVFEKRRGSNDFQRRGSAGSVATAEKALSVDKAIAAQVDAMLSMNESKASGCGFSTHSRTSHTAGHRRGNRPKPRRQDSRFSVSSNTFVPPSLPSLADRPSLTGERYLPESMDDIFSSKKSSKRGKKKKPSDGKKKKKTKGKPLKP